ncbi:MAG TPA: transposase, partial [Terracidiphilus sp.]
KGIEEMVADKGYHSGALLERVTKYQVRSYIPERQQKGQRKWEGKAGQQQAVYANRRRVQGNYGKSLLRRRGELVERSFAHCYDTGGMRRTHLRKHNNILKRQLIHVAGFNLSLIFRKLLGAGTPREWNNRGRMLLLFLLGLFTRPQEHYRRCRSMILRSRTAPAETAFVAARSTSCRRLVGYTTGC